MPTSELSGVTLNEVESELTCHCGVQSPIPFMEVFSYWSHGVLSVVPYGHSVCKRKECALPEELGGGGKVWERNGNNDDKDYEE